MLGHPHFLTIEAWVWKDLDDVYDPAMSAIPGIVFRKNGPLGVHFGIDFGHNNVWFWHMNKYVDYLHGIATTDSEWHFLSATFVRYDIASLTNMYVQVDDTSLGTY